VSKDYKAGISDLLEVIECMDVNTRHQSWYEILEKIREKAEQLKSDNINR
jgi:hypothetical protein